LVPGKAAAEYTRWLDEQPFACTPKILDSPLGNRQKPWDWVIGELAVAEAAAVRKGADGKVPTAAATAVWPVSGADANLASHHPFPGSAVAEIQTGLPFTTRVLPSLLVIGAHKAGSTSLFHYLSQLPSVQPSLCKEVHFFDVKINSATSGVLNPTLLPGKRKATASECKSALLQQYSLYFRDDQRATKPAANATTPGHSAGTSGGGRTHEAVDSTPKLISIEGTPAYFHEALSVAPLVRWLLPNVTLLASLRSPAARSISHFQNKHAKDYYRLVSCNQWIATAAPTIGARRCRHLRPRPARSYGGVWQENADVHDSIRGRPNSTGTGVGDDDTISSSIQTKETHSTFSTRDSFNNMDNVGGSVSMGIRSVWYGTWKSQWVKYSECVLKGGTSEAHFRNLKPPRRESLNPARDAKSQLREQDIAITRSEYGPMLFQWMQHFPPEQLQMVVFESMVADTVTTMRELAQKIHATTPAFTADQPSWNQPGMFPNTNPTVYTAALPNGDGGAGELAGETIPCHGVRSKLVAAMKPVADDFLDVITVYYPDQVDLWTRAWPEYNLSRGL
jgi:hypothetical protein